MKTLKKIALKLVAVTVVLTALFMLQGSASAAGGFTKTQVENARVYFKDNSAKTLTVAIGGQSIDFSGKPDDKAGKYQTILYKPADTAAFCSPAVNTAGAKPNPLDSYLSVSVANASGGGTLSGTIDASGQSDPARVPASNLYAGSTPQDCQRGIPKNKSVVLIAGAASSAMFTDKTTTNIRGSSFVFTDGATISFTFNSQQILFRDSNPEDDDRSFPPKADNDAALFCKKIDGVHFKTNNQGKDPLPVTFELAYIDTGDGNQCKTKTLSLSIPNTAKIATKVLEWDNEKLRSITGSISLSLQTNASSIYLKNTNDICGGGYAVVLDSAGGNSGKLYQVAPGSGAASIGLRNCEIKSERSVLIGGTAGESAITAGENQGSSADCVASGSTGLEWLLCPFTTALSTAVDKFNGIIESQLNFDVEQNLSNSQAPHTAWAIIKNLTSVILVILLLVMVISQALGNGPFEAYTIKKMLPKLVIAIIAMQISWDLCKYLITLANDAGQGLSQLLTAPFGGPGNVDLNSILHRLDPDKWALTSTLIIPALLLGGVLIAFMALPGVFVMAFSLFIGVFAAFMVLLFRNVLIEALVIFSPLAFLAWTMTGTQSYWKLWKGNFTKLLLMFPLIMAIIFSGRIFAWIVAGGGNAGFIDYMTIMIAYFGPYFVIFKSYKWGGSLMSAAGNGISAGRRGIVKANEGWIKEKTGHLQGWTADRYSIAHKALRLAGDDVEMTKNKIAEYKKRRQTIDDSKKGAPKKAREIDKLNKEFGITGLKDLEDKLPALEQKLKEEQRKGRLQRARLRTAAGFPIPGRRGQLRTLARASEYKEELVKQKQALIHNDYVEQTNSGKSVGEAKEYIRDKYGIGNYEAVTEDILDSSGKIVGRKVVGHKTKDKYTARAFNNWLVDTASWMELGDQEWIRGAIKDDKGNVIGYKSAQGEDPISLDQIKRGVKPKLNLVENLDFIGMMNADGQRYRAVAEKFPEYQPFQQSLGGGAAASDPDVQAEARKGIKVDDYKPGGRYAKWNRSGSDAEAAQLYEEQVDQKATLIAKQKHFARVFRQLEHPSDIANWRAENFEIMASTLDGLEKMGIKKESTDLYKAMSKQFEELKEARDAGSQEAASIMQRLTGGEKSARLHVNAILGQNWIEDALHLPVRVETGVETRKGTGTRRDIQVSETQRFSALPKETQKYLERLATIQRDSNGKVVLAPEIIETAKVVAEGNAYSEKAHGVRRQVHIDRLLQLKDYAEQTNNRELAAQINAMLDLSEQEVNQTVQRIISTQAPSGPPRGYTTMDDFETYITSQGQERRREISALRPRMPSEADDPTTVLKIDHGTTTPSGPIGFSKQVQDATDSQIQLQVTRAGGWSNMSNSDLMRIYNYRGGNLKTLAEQELRNRGLFTTP